MSKYIIAKNDAKKKDFEIYFFTQYTFNMSI